MTSSPAERPCSPSETSGLISSQASGAPSLPSLGASPRFRNGERTKPTGRREYSGMSAPGSLSDLVLPIDERDCLGRTGKRCFLARGGVIFLVLTLSPAHTASHHIVEFATLSPMAWNRSWGPRNGHTTWTRSPSGSSQVPNSRAARDPCGRPDHLL